MITKEKLVKYVEKYHLNNTIESAILSVENNRVKTVFKSSNADLRGQIEMTDFDFPDSKLGIYTTSQLLKMAAILNGNLEVKLLTVPEKRKKEDGTEEEINSVKRIELTDILSKTIKYATCQLDIIDFDGKVAQFKTQDVKVKLDKNIISSILEANAALPSKGITFMKSNDKLKVIFNYSDGNDNCIDFEIDADELDEDFDFMTFDANYIKQILSVNSKKFDEAYLYITSKGVLTITFRDEDSFSEYWIVRLKD